MNRPYRSSDCVSHRTRLAPILRSRACAARRPHGQASPAMVSHCWDDSGASIPLSRMRWPWISSVSPSITLARPARTGGSVPAIEGRLHRARIRIQIRQAGAVRTVPPCSRYVPITSSKPPIHLTPDLGRPDPSAHDRRPRAAEWLRARDRRLLWLVRSTPSAGQLGRLQP